MGLKECKNLPMTSNESPSEAHFALARAVVELEEHVSTRGWDGPTSVFALVRTADATGLIDPSLAQLTACPGGARCPARPAVIDEH